MLRPSDLNESPKAKNTPENSTTFFNASKNNFCFTTSHQTGISYFSAALFNRPRGF